MATGWEMLGSALGGNSEQAYQEGRYRSAQTEDALLRARGRQLENTALETKAANRGRIEEEAAKAGVDNPSLFAALALGEVNPQQFMGGVQTQQNIGFRSQIADPTTDYDTVQRLRAASGDAPFNPIDAVGTMGAFSDARNPDAAVQVPPGARLGGTGGGVTAPIQIFDRVQQLLREGRNEEAQQLLDIQRARQPFNAGGVPYQLPSPIAPVTGQPTTPQPVVPLGEVAANAGAVETGKQTARYDAKFAAAQPKARATMDSMQAKTALATDKINQILADSSAIGWGTGFTSLGNVIPGTPGARLRNELVSLRAQLGFQELQDMRASSPTGGALGQVSNAENELLQNAYVNLIESSDEQTFVRNITQLKSLLAQRQQRLEDAYMRDYGGYENRAAPAAAAPAAQGPVSISSQEAYNALPSGTQFIAPDGSVRVKP